LPGPFVIGVDLGGTKLAAGAVSVDGKTQFALHNELTHAEEGADAVTARIARMIDAVIADACASSGAARSDFLGVGVGAPGPLDRARGIVVVAPNLRWKNYPLAPNIAAQVGLPVQLDNDANCATLGEWWLGAGRGTRHMLGVTLGTGIGGGLILNGELYHGASDVAGEVGHTTIETQGRHCACGNYGCLEAYASGPAIAERAREALGDDRTSLLASRVGGEIARITAQTVYEAAEEGDRLALEVVRDTARFLGAGVANLLNVFNPEIVVLAGGVTAAGDNLFEPLRTEVRRRAFRPAWESARIVPGELGTNAGVAGAAAMFVQQHKRG
jgi:glucokinase